MSTMTRLPATLTADEAARIMRVPRSTMYDALKRGDIPSFRIGRRLRIPTPFVLEMLSGREPSSTA